MHKQDHTFKILKTHVIRGVVHSKKSWYTTPKKTRKNRKKSKKSKDFCWGFNFFFKIRTPYLGVNSSSNSVFKSFFLFIKFSYTKKKIRKIRKIQKEIQGFFLGFKIRAPYLGVNNPSMLSLSCISTRAQFSYYCSITKFLCYYVFHAQ